MKVTLAIAAIFRDEAPYLKEWIEFHRAVGVERFYLFDNLSTDHCVRRFLLLEKDVRKRSLINRLAKTLKRNEDLQVASISL